jgi:hypothetical protein
MSVPTLSELYQVWIFLAGIAFLIALRKWIRRGL